MLLPMLYTITLTIFLSCEGTANVIVFILKPLAQQATVLSKYQYNESSPQTQTSLGYQSYIYTAAINRISSLLSIDLQAQNLMATATFLVLVELPVLCFCLLPCTSVDYLYRTCTYCIFAVFVAIAWISLGFAFVFSCSSLVSCYWH